MEFGLLVDGVKKAGRSYLDNIVAYLVGIVLFFIIAGIAYFIGFGGDFWAVYEAFVNGEFGLSLLIMIVTTVIGFLLISPLTYSLYYMAIKGTRSSDVKIGDLFYAFKSGKAYVRSLIYTLVYAIIIAVVTALVALVSDFVGYVIAFASESVGILIGGLLYIILMLLVEIFFFFTIYIYVMRPDEGFFYALKESISVGKSNIVMVLLTIIISWILSILIITIPLGYIFGAYMLKELNPMLKDMSGMESEV
ncbi:hypothetical protein MmiEs2_00990 [Methanimicrococcus stummii]|uniref:Glycerophosphoryl diester phosphodiesterase membrane domain-containing protein n=1 Tax=Methanimicrococcus stummii TaxID=3028294 RepID=A0AA96ZWE7_9EURY|nr:hypothetical protein [Methanimicrococcus sp. Es2]WNY27920.1 hypothetical protein MmiEs2_00990 [Methanimicrococcus sp. Es2]